MLNQAVIMGRLCADPELRRTQNGSAVVSFTLAVDRDFANQDGSRDTDFIPVVGWRNTAEFVSKWFTKGSMAIVTGRIQVRDYTDREGNKRRTTEIVADKIHFGESKRNRDEADYAEAERAGKKGNYTPAAAPVSVFDEDDDGDLPF